MVLKKNGADRLVQCGFVTNLQFAKKKKNAITTKSNEVQENKVRL
jgi:hypothetical protein